MLKGTISRIIAKQEKIQKCFFKLQKLIEWKKKKSDPLSVKDYFQSLFDKVQQLSERT